MKVTPFGSPLSPDEIATFAERTVVPTFEALKRLRAEGTIVAGGPTAGAMAFAFVLRARSHEEVDDLLSPLPLWSRMQTTITPLSTFEHRDQLTRSRLEKLKEKLRQAPQLAAR